MAAGQPAPRFEADITVVTLPVFVTDNAGAAVPGLRLEDFEVLDDGRPMKVVGFREIDVAEATEEELRAASPAARRQFLLLFDLSFSSVGGLVRSRKAAGRFVETLAPSDLAAVATFSANHGVRLLVGFTSDRAQLRRAVDTLGVLQLDRRADPLGLSYDLTDIGAAFADTVAFEGQLNDAIRAVQIRFEQSQQALYRQKILALLEGLGQLAVALDSVQGRKQVVFLSSGFEDTSLTGVTGAQAVADSEAVIRGRLWEVQSESRFGDAQVRTELSRVLQRFSSSDALIHTIDLTGLAARGDTTYTSSEPVRASSRESLSEIANMTGGRLFKDANDLGRAFEEISRMSQRYYLLAFEPQAMRGSGKFHKLKVKVGGKGRQVSHRSGYFERAPFAERTPLARRFQAAEVITKGVTEDGIAVRALAIPYRGETGVVSLPVVLEADGTRLLAPGGNALSLEIYGYAMEEGGKMVDFLALATNLDLAKVGGRIREKGLQVHGTFTLKPGKHNLRFLIRDAASGRMGSAWLEVTMPAFDEGEVMLFPPLFMDQPARWLILDAPSPASKGAVSPFQVDKEPFTPITRPLLANGRTSSWCLMAFDGGRKYDPGASFEIKPSLVDKQGAPVRVGKVTVTRTMAEADGFRRFVLDVTPSDVAPGDYSFRVRLRDPASGRISEAYQAVRVEAP
jgi:VWFA-related protein